MAPTSGTTSNKNCRKCKGSCPPCRPWRCKYVKGRSLQDCCNDFETNQVKSHASSKQKNSQPIITPSKNESLKDIGVVLSSLRLSNDSSEPTSSDKSSGALLAFEETSSNRITRKNTSRFRSPKSTQHRKMLPFPVQMKEPDTSHIFLAIAADPLLVEYSKTVLKHVIAMPEIPEINSRNDSRCIWSHSVHLTIHSFGKVLNRDIPRIAEYCRKNIEVIAPFDLNITGLLHHQRLHTIGYTVEKRSVEPLRQIKMNLSTWFKKGTNWDWYTPILSLLRTKGPPGAKFSCKPISERSINIILQKFGNIRYFQNVIPCKNIQLCLARSSTATSFYKNLL